MEASIVSSAVPLAHADTSGRSKMAKNRLRMNLRPATRRLADLAGGSHVDRTMLRRKTTFLGILTLLLPCPTGSVHAHEEHRLFAELRRQVATDLRAGRPLTVLLHVPLCDNALIHCGGRGRGDPESLARNLYWDTLGGARGWFDRARSPYRRTSLQAASGEILETRSWRSPPVEPGPAWRALGVERSFEVVITAHAWRGQAIDAALATFLRDLHRGSAHLVAWAGHNRFMDLPTYDFARVRGGTSASRRAGAIMLACKTEPYLRGPLAEGAIVPLLLTRDFVFPGAFALDGALTAFASGGSLAEIRLRAAQAYAKEQRKELTRVQSVFTNPSDRRWLSVSTGEGGRKR
jgi:hypothetical protein